MIGVTIRNTVQFDLVIKKWTETTNAQIRLAVEKIAMECLRRIVMKNPVGNVALWKHPVMGYVGGRSRGNWYVSMGVPYGSYDWDVRDAGGGATIERGASVLATWDGVAVIFITNHLPYIVALEYGHSTQAPYGMVGVTMGEMGGDTGVQTVILSGELPGPETQAA